MLATTSACTPVTCCPRRGWGGHVLLSPHGSDVACRLCATKQSRQRGCLDRAAPNEDKSPSCLEPTAPRGDGLQGRAAGAQMCPQPALPEGRGWAGRGGRGQNRWDRSRNGQEQM